MDPLRVGVVPYLNAKPLVYRLERHAPVVAAPPSRLVELLDANLVQVASVPAAYLSEQRGVRLEVAVIASTRAAESVLLFYRDSLRNVRTLALNAHSHTSNALARVVLRDMAACSPQLSVHEPDLEAMLSDCDAAVLIGDYALACRQTRFPRLDLGAAWNYLTGLPMVWALWVARDQAAADAAQPLLESAKEAGLAALDLIAAEHARTSGLSADFCLRYLSETMSYDFEPAEREGLAEFLRRSQTLADR